MSRSMRLLLLQRSLSDHIRSSTSRALDALSKTAGESRLAGEWRGSLLCLRALPHRSVLLVLVLRRSFKTAMSLSHGGAGGGGGGGGGKGGDGKPLCTANSDKQNVMLS